MRGFDKMKVLTIVIPSYKKADAYNNASSGMNIGYGTQFKGITHLTHGLYGCL